MAGYAANTSVGIDKTRAEIENALRKYGAGKFSSGWDEDAGIAFVAFHCRDRVVRFTVPLPKPTEQKFTHTARGKRRVASQAAEEYEQAKRSVWRRLLLVIRAKLESVESGIESFEDSFLAQIVTPTGETMGTWAKRELALAYNSGEMPNTLRALPPHQGEK